MKIRMILIVALVIVLALPATLQAQEPDPTATIKAMEDALNAGDVDAAMAFFTDDAVVKLEFFGDTCTGADEIRVWFEELVAGNFQIQVEVLQIDGDTVTAKTTTWIDFTREMGIAPLIATEVYTFQDGKIAGFTWIPTDETAAKIQTVLAATLPETGGASFPIHVLALALGGLVILSGLSLTLRQRR
ncbi:MAG TPA: SnoaL-like domain-containing protein [Chloroflexi bacterium]|nr:SnoaL-like domain-containing protein [Chloroflexota bacterium]